MPDRDKNNLPFEVFPMDLLLMTVLTWVALWGLSWLLLKSILFSFVLGYGIETLPKYYPWLLSAQPAILFLVWLSIKKRARSDKDPMLAQIYILMILGTSTLVSAVIPLVMHRPGEYDLIVRFHVLSRLSRNILDNTPLSLLLTTAFCFVPGLPANRFALKDKYGKLPLSSKDLMPILAAGLLAATPSLAIGGAFFSVLLCAAVINFMLIRAIRKKLLDSGVTPII